MATHMRNFTPRVLRTYVLNPRLEVLGVVFRHNMRVPFDAAHAVLSHRNTDIACTLTPIAQSDYRIYLF